MRAKSDRHPANRPSAVTDSFGGRLGRQRAVGGLDDFLIDLRFERLQLFLVQDAFAHQEQAEARNRIALRFRFALLRGVL